MSVRLKNKVLKITNDIYNQCVSEVFELSETSEATIDAIKILMDLATDYPWMYAASPLNTMKSPQEIKELAIKKELVSNLYQQKIMQLSDKDLNDIVRAHKKDLVKRADRTIENILSELARRALLGDTNESDLNDIHGEMDEFAVKTRTSSKKTSSKRRKALKNKQGN